MKIGMAPKGRVSSAPKTPPYPNGMRGFFAWMKARNPRLYRVGLPAVTQRAALSGLGITGDSAVAATVASETGPVAPSLADKIKDILLGVSQAYLTNEQMKAQKRVLDAQLARAQAGLPPLDIDMSQYGMGPSVGVGLSPQTQTFLMWGLAAAGAIYLVPKLLKR